MCFFSWVSISDPTRFQCSVPILQSQKWPCLNPMGDEKKPKVINLGKGQIRRATGQAWEGETKEWK